MNSFDVALQIRNIRGLVVTLGTMLIPDFIMDRFNVHPEAPILGEFAVTQLAVMVLDSVMDSLDMGC